MICAGTRVNFKILPANNPPFPRENKNKSQFPLKFSQFPQMRNPVPANLHSRATSKNNSRNVKIASPGMRLKNLCLIPVPVKFFSSLPLGQVLFLFYPHTLAFPRAFAGVSHRGNSFPQFQCLRHIKFLFFPNLPTVFHFRSRSLKKICEIGEICVKKSCVPARNTKTFVPFAVKNVPAKLPSRERQNNMKNL